MKNCSFCSPFNTILLCGLKLHLNQNLIIKFRVPPQHFGAVKMSSFISTFSEATILVKVQLKHQFSTHFFGVSELTLKTSCCFQCNSLIFLFSTSSWPKIPELRIRSVRIAISRICDQIWQLRCYSGTPKLCFAAFPPNFRSIFGAYFRGDIRSYQIYPDIPACICPSFHPCRAVRGTVRRVIARCTPYNSSETVKLGLGVVPALIMVHRGRAVVHCAVCIGLFTKEVHHSLEHLQSMANWEHDVGHKALLLNIEHFWTSFLYNLFLFYLFTHP